MLNVELLGKKFGREWIFRNVSFHLKEKQCLVVTGKNGSGKTTLLRILTGLENSSEGIVQLNLEDSRKEIGFSSPDLRLYGTLTGMEHLSLSQKLRGETPKQGKNEVLLELFGLKQHAHKLVSAYSTGMRARLKLAIATESKRNLLILDEPFSNLDEEGCEILQNIIQQQKSHGILIFSTNNPGEIKFGDYELNLA